MQFASISFKGLKIIDKSYLKATSDNKVALSWTPAAALAPPE